MKNLLAFLIGSFGFLLLMGIDNPELALIEVATHGIVGLVFIITSVRLARIS